MVRCHEVLKDAGDVLTAQYGKVYSTVDDIDALLRELDGGEGR